MQLLKKLRNFFKNILIKIKIFLHPADYCSLLSKGGDNGVL
jgi:hypothetical protein